MQLSEINGYMVDNCPTLTTLDLQLTYNNMAARLYNDISYQTNYMMRYLQYYIECMYPDKFKGMSLLRSNYPEDIPSLIDSNNNNTALVMYHINSNFAESKNKVQRARKILEHDGWVYNRTYSSALTLTPKTVVTALQKDNQLFIYTNDPSPSFINLVWCLMFNHIDIHQDTLLEKVGRALYREDYKTICDVMEDYFLKEGQRLTRITITNKLQNIVESARKRELENVIKDIKLAKETREEYMELIKSQTKLIRDFQLKQWTLENKPSESSLKVFIDILSNSDSVAHVVIDPNRHSEITIVFKTPLIHYDKDTVQFMLESSNKTKLNKFSPNIQRFFKNVFIENNTELFLEGIVTFNLIEKFYNIKQTVYGKGMPNPHLLGHRCIGGYASELSYAINHDDYEMFYSIMLTAVGSINFTDGTVLDTWLRNLNDHSPKYCGVKCLLYKENMYTYTEYIKLMAKEIEDEKIKADEQRTAQATQQDGGGTGQTIEQALHSAEDNTVVRHVETHVQEQAEDLLQGGRMAQDAAIGTVQQY